MKKMLFLLLLCSSLLNAQVTMHFLGDCTIGSDARWPVFDQFAATVDPSYFFSGVIHITGNDDYTIANLETTIIDTGTPREKQFRFKGKPAYLEILKKGSVESVTLANNHTWDYGDSGYAHTRYNLDAAGIEYFAWDKVLYKNFKGLSFAFIGQAFYLQNHVLPLIRSLRDTIDFIIVVMHWGNEKEYQPNATQIKMARELIDAGADLIVGHHPHVVQPVMTYNNVPIAYSIGNFVFGGNRNPRDKRALILKAVFEKNRPVTVTSIPVKISSVDTTNDFRPVIVSETDAR